MTALLPADCLCHTGLSQQHPSRYQCHRYEGDNGGGGDGRMVILAVEPDARKGPDHGQPEKRVL